MALTRRGLALDAVGVTLTAIGGLTYFRNLDREPEPAEMNCIIQIDGGHVAKTIYSGTAVKTLAVAVECYVTAAALDDMADAIDDVSGKVIKALIADVSLGGMAIDVRDTEMSDPAILSEDQEKPYAEFTLDFEIDFEHGESDPYAAN